VSKTPQKITPKFSKRWWLGAALLEPCPALRGMQGKPRGPRPALYPKRKTVIKRHKQRYIETWNQRYSHLAR